MKVLHLEVDPS